MAISEKQALKLQKEVDKRRAKIMDAVFAGVTKKSALNDLQAVQKLLDDNLSKEDTLNRVRAFIEGMLLKQRRDEAAKANKSAKSRLKASVSRPDLKSK